MLWIIVITWTFSDHVIVSVTLCASLHPRRRPRSCQDASLTLCKARIPVVSGTLRLADARCLTILASWCSDHLTLLPRSGTVNSSVRVLSQRKSALYRQITISHTIFHAVYNRKSGYIDKMSAFTKRHTTGTTRYDLTCCSNVRLNTDRLPDCLPHDRNKLTKTKWK